MFKAHAGSEHQLLPFDAENLELMLRRHVIEVWFPRSLDMEAGGFLCDFDRAWKPCGGHEKFLEFQARQTLFAAEAALFFPSDALLRRVAVHGFNYLLDVLWDKKAGGWFHRLDRAGNPLEVETKHVHGAAYAIQACVAVYRLTNDLAALELAQAGFAWLDYAHDSQHGGYFGFLTRDNKIIRAAADCPWEAEVDTIGTPIGYKDQNIHSDLLETFIYLQRVSNDVEVCERLDEIIEITSVKMLNDSGAQHFWCQADWKPEPHFVHYGTVMQSTFRLMLAGELTGNEEKLTPVARRLLNHGIRHGWDSETDGFNFAGPGCLPTWLENSDLVVRDKSWWVQTEALKALALMSRIDADNHDYRQSLDLLWDYLQKCFFDGRDGGMFTYAPVTTAANWKTRFGFRASAAAPAAWSRKGWDWKDSSHEGRALLTCLRLLRGDCLGEI